MQRGTHLSSNWLRISPSELSGISLLVWINRYLSDPTGITSERLNPVSDASTFFSHLICGLE